MLGAGDPLGADGVLAQIENHPRFGARARQLRAGSVPTPGGVPLERVGNQFYVSANLDGAMDVTLMVDTGAAMIVLGAQRLLMLGYDLDAAPKRYFSTAGGVVRAPVVRLDRFELGGRTVGTGRLAQSTCRWPLKLPGCWEWTFCRGTRLRSTRIGNC